MNEACATCAKHDTCFYSSEKVIDCTRHEPKPETNYEKVFGTPERVARSISDACKKDNGEHGGCGGCPVVGIDCGCGDYDALLEWLRGEGEGE